MLFDFYVNTVAATDWEQGFVATFGFTEAQFGQMFTNWLANQPQPGRCRERRLHPTRREISSPRARLCVPDVRRRGPVIGAARRSQRAQPARPTS